ncbi:ShlB/FhaC/HecB family hemolysin secretion/activation protein [Hydrocarboniphaga sp.]|uniref:ShlB/FhaC/HecB family hemolysin secretion/activation protein n=1 Tax=Hydrocarboniphaga sp. TaxID=2033016 RepID=UPI003D0DB597
MPVIAPPPLIPQQATVELIRQQPSTVRVAFRDAEETVQIELHGAALLDAAQASAALKRAKTLSDALYELAQACADGGYPATQLTYARSGDVVYVQLTPGGVSSVSGPPRLAAFFRGIEREQPLTDATLERRQLLASLYADRSDLTVQPKLIAGDAGTVFDLKPDRQSRSTPIASVDFGNPGNRFVGRYFSNAELRYAFDSGDEFKASWNHGFTDLGETRGADGYEEQNLVWSRVTPYGVFGLGGRNVDYGQNLENPAPLRNNLLHYDSDIQRLQASALLPLMARRDWRWLLDASADYSHRRYRETTTDSLMQNQEYGSLQLASFYVADATLLLQPLDISVGASLRKGLGDDRSGDQQVAADLGYLSLRPELRLNWNLGMQWRLRFDALGQYSRDILPVEEQWVLGGADGVQAFLPGVAVGDSGAIAKLALERNSGQLGALRLRIGVFSEYGYAKFSDAGAAVDAQSVADIGIALRASLRHVEASVSAAEPVHDSGIPQSVVDDARSRLLFRLKAMF